MDVLQYAPQSACSSLAFAFASFFVSFMLTSSDNYDNLTNGDIIWVNQSVADSSPQLTYVNSAGHAIIKVDNSSTVPYNDKRNSVRITSNDTYGLGTVWIMDAVHLPYGCSVWWVVFYRHLSLPRFVVCCPHVSSAPYRVGPVPLNSQGPLFGPKELNHRWERLTFWRALTK